MLFLDSGRLLRRWTSTSTTPILSVKWSWMQSNWRWELLIWRSESIISQMLSLMTLGDSSWRRFCCGSLGADHWSILERHTLLDYRHTGAIRCGHPHLKRAYCPFRVIQVGACSLLHDVNEARTEASLHVRKGFSTSQCSGHVMSSVYGQVWWPA